MCALKTTIKTLLCLVLLEISRQETPQYSYECKENGDLVLHGFSLDSFIQLESVNSMTFGTDDNCTTSTYSSDKYGHISIPKECINGTDVTINRTVVFRAFDSLIDGTIAPPTPPPKPPTTATIQSLIATTTPIPTSPATPVLKLSQIAANKSTVNASESPKPSSVHGGRRKRNVSTPSYGQRYHYFSIQCSAITKGVVDHVIGHVGVKNVASLPNVFNSIGTVEMRFKSEEASTDNHKDINDLTDIFTVYLGDKFYMYLKYIGQQDYSISPQNCTAYGDGERAVVEKDTRQQKVELWNYNVCVSELSKRLHLMHTFKNLADNIVYAEMFGFHFDIDADITIECDVKVCTKKSTDSTCKPTNCTNKDWKMAKRSTREEDNRVTVKGKLHVLEHQTGNSNSAGLVHFKWTVLVILQIMLYLY